MLSAAAGMSAAQARLQAEAAESMAPCHGRYFLKRTF
jgi:hypothetical protein